MHNYVHNVNRVSDLARKPTLGFLSRFVHG
jgi:hypothetical protein